MHVLVLLWSGCHCNINDRPCLQAPAPVPALEDLVVREEHVHRSAISNHFNQQYCNSNLTILTAQMNKEFLSKDLCPLESGGSGGLVRIWNVRLFRRSNYMITIYYMVLLWSGCHCNINDRPCLQAPAPVPELEDLVVRMGHIHRSVISSYLNPQCCNSNLTAQMNKEFLSKDSCPLESGGSGGLVRIWNVRLFRRSNYMLTVWMILYAETIWYYCDQDAIIT